MCGPSGVPSVTALSESLSAPVCTSYLHNDAFPRSHPNWMGPLGYQGSKAAMKTISEADVVLALGTRLGPFGSLPQYGFDYWPSKAKIIQASENCLVFLNMPALYNSYEKKYYYLISPRFQHC